jgi:hypothetical protein
VLRGYANNSSRTFRQPRAKKGRIDQEESTGHAKPQEALEAQSYGSTCSNQRWSRRAKSCPSIESVTKELGGSPGPAGARAGDVKVSSGCANVGFARNYNSRLMSDGTCWHSWQLAAFLVVKAGRAGFWTNFSASTATPSFPKDIEQNAYNGQGQQCSA